MNKYLFDRITVEENGNVKFCTFRDVAIRESFLTHTNVIKGHGICEVLPSSYKEFLTMLKRTKLNDEGEYNITLCVDGKEENYSFYSLIDYFASKVYMYNYSMHLSTVGRFITQAYSIKELATKEQSGSIEEAQTTID